CSLARLKQSRKRWQIRMRQARKRAVRPGKRFSSVSLCESAEFTTRQGVLRLSATKPALRSAPRIAKSRCENRRYKTTDTDRLHHQDGYSYHSMSIAGRASAYR